MQNSSSKIYLISPKLVIISSFIVFILSFIPFTYSTFNNLTETTFNIINFHLKKFQLETNQYLIIEAYDTNQASKNNHIDHINKLLFTLVKMQPSMIILDSQYPKNQKILEPWIKKTGEKIIFTYDSFNEDLNNEIVDSPINRAFFVVNQKRNLEIINFVTKQNLLSIGQIVAKIFSKSKKILPKNYKIKYYFNDSMIPIVAIEDFKNKKISSGSLKNKIVFVRTHQLSFFKHPCLTPIGILNADTLMANDIQTILNYEIPYEIKNYQQKILLLIFILIISLIFIRAWLLKAIFYSILFYDIQFVIGFMMYNYLNIQYDYFIFGFYSLFHILILILLSLLNINRMQDSLEEMDKIKKYLIVQNQAMAHLKKLSELGRISSGIYHEINNPLHNIFNSLKMLKTDNSLCNDSKETLDIALFEITRLQKLSKNLKGFYKPLDTKFENINVHDIIEFSIKLISPSLRSKDISVIKNFVNFPLAIFSNTDKLQQVILNLLINSIDAIKEKGTIFISTNIKENKIEIKIKDTGLGIPEENRKEIFKAFFTTKGDSGTGLGLFVSYEIINQLGGDIILSEYKNGEGAEFIIFLSQHSAL